MRLTLTQEQFDVLNAVLDEIGAKSVPDAVRQGLEAQIDAARSLRREQSTKVNLGEKHP